MSHSRKDKLLHLLCRKIALSELGGGENQLLTIVKYEDAKRWENAEVQWAVGLHFGILIFFQFSCGTENRLFVQQHIKKTVILLYYYTLLHTNQVIYIHANRCA